MTRMMCDICAKEISLPLYKVILINSAGTDTIQLEYDLCNECLQKFKKFMLGGTNNNES